MANRTPTGASSCHFLPCDIEYDGNAPVHVYFQPTPLGNDNDNDNSSAHADAKGDETSKTKDQQQQQPTILAAQLRGRGLLCVEPTPLPTDVVGTVLSTDNSKKNSVEIMAKFDSIHEWHHEHDVRSLKRMELKGKGVGVRAVDWIDVARAVHEPVE